MKMVWEEYVCVCVCVVDYSIVRVVEECVPLSDS